MKSKATLLLAVLAVAGGIAAVKAELDPSWQDTEMTTRCGLRAASCACRCAPHRSFVRAPHAGARNGHPRPRARLPAAVLYALRAKFGARRLRPAGAWPANLSAAQCLLPHHTR